MHVQLVWYDDRSVPQRITPDTLGRVMDLLACLQRETHAPVEHGMLYLSEHMFRELRREFSGSLRFNPGNAAGIRTMFVRGVEMRQHIGLDNNQCLFQSVTNHVVVRNF